MESTVTVSIGFHNQRRTILTGYYRQWADKLDGKRSIKKQESCLTNQMNLWQNLIDDNLNKEAIFLGDFNLDANNFDKNEKQKTKNEKNYNKMNKTIKEGFTERGLCLMNKTPTRNSIIRNSQLDHFYTNKPGKIQLIEQRDETDSDHSCIIIHRKIY